MRKIESEEEEHRKKELALMGPDSDGAFRFLNRKDGQVPLTREQARNLGTGGDR